MKLYGLCRSLLQKTAKLKSKRSDRILLGIYLAYFLTSKDKTLTAYSRHRANKKITKAAEHCQDLKFGSNERALYALNAILVTFSIEEIG